MLNQPNKRSPTDRNHSYKTSNWNKYKSVPVIYILRNPFSEIILLWESENKIWLMILVPPSPPPPLHQRDDNFPGDASGKEPASQCRRDSVQSPDQEGPLEEGNSYPLQYSCLENPMDRRAWWAAVYRAAESWTQLKWLSTHAKKL